MTMEGYDKLLAKPENTNFVIYHGYCSDGFTSALASYHFFKKTNNLNVNNEEITYYPASFSVPPPDVTDKHVVICDFSYKYDQIMTMIKQAKSFVILDHHKTAQAELEKVPEEYKIFRMDHSGAYLTWKYFFPNDDVPLLVKYVEDNDIWKKEMPNTRDVTAYIFTLPFEFDKYAELLDDDKIKEIMIIGNGMNRQNTDYLTKSMGYNVMKFVEIDRIYYFVVHHNSTVLKSEFGNEVLKKYPNCDFSAIYSTLGNVTYFSLRSDDKKTDVSQITKLYGGGGHRNASGMTLRGSTEFGNVIDNNIMYNLLDNVYFGNITIDEKVYSIAYLNCSHHKKHIGKYLLQNKYFEEGKPVQQCCSCVRNKNNNNNYVYCHFSYIWNYDGYENKTWVTISWIDNSMTPILIKLFEKKDNYQLCDNDKRINFTLSGCVAHFDQ